MFAFSSSFLTWVYDNVIDWRKGSLRFGDIKDVAPGTRATHVLSAFRSVINACGFSVRLHG